MHPRTWTAADWQAIGTIAGVLVAIIGGIAIWVQIKQAAGSRDDQSRPYVIVDFEFRGQLVLLAVRNIGTSAALNVTMKFDKRLRRPGHRSDLHELPMFAKPIPMLAPGRRIRASLGSAVDLLSQSEDEFPRTYEVTISYSRQRRRRPYVDPPAVLDLNTYVGSSVEPDHIHDIARGIEAIRDSMKSWTHSYGRGIQVVPQTFDDV